MVQSVTASEVRPLALAGRARNEIVPSGESRERDLLPISAKKSVEHFGSSKAE